VNALKDKLYKITNVSGSERKFLNANGQWVTLKNGESVEMFANPCRPDIFKTEQAEEKKAKIK